MCLILNGRTARIAALASQLNLPFVAEAMKPSPAGCRRGLEILNLPRTAWQSSATRSSPTFWLAV